MLGFLFGIDWAVLIDGDLERHGTLLNHKTDYNLRVSHFAFSSRALAPNCLNLVWFFLHSTPVALECEDAVP